MSKTDVYILPPDPAIYRAEIAITEKRAPTDASVKLLREMEAKAQAEVVKAIAVQSNDFNCVVQRLRDHMSDMDRYRAVFRLNGKTMMAVFAQATMDPNEPFLNLRDQMAKIIATEVLGDAFLATMRERWRCTT